MTPTDYRNFEYCQLLCNLLKLELHSTSDKFSLSNNIVYLKYFDTIEQIILYLEGYKQCKRELDEDFNSKLLIDDNIYEENLE